MTSPIDWLKRAPDQATALILAKDQTLLDYGTLRRLVAERSAFLRREIPSCHTVLGLYFQDNLESWLSFLAALHAGFACFPVNAKFDPALAEERMRAFYIGFALSDQPLPQIPCLNPSVAEEKEGKETHPFASVPLSEESLHVIISTSGSTGQPKGVMLSGANLAASVLASHTHLPLSPSDCWAAAMPISGIGGLSVFLRCLEAGASCLVFNGFETEPLGHYLQSGAISHLSVTPAMLDRLLQRGIHPHPRLKKILTGGAALSFPLWERAQKDHWPVLPSYGLSETASQAATFDLPPSCWHPGLVGRVLPHLEAALSADGRLRLRGSSVMMGYVEGSDFASGSGLDQEGWFQTSDLAKIDNEGRIEILGRADYVLISGGYTISPEEVETRVFACPDLQAVAITGKKDPVWGDKITAFFVGNLEPDSFLLWCAENIPSPLRPREAIRLPALPLLANGKIDRQALGNLAKGDPSLAD